ncbi:MAG TPA: dihydrolipoamide acetyltransferase family protein [Candidatus Binatia bacterium]|jgi:pyruvate dehydrogenase E2 component (dihydrolipoamide acetyltransferase)|nr:dihydrolipoamide acetyltransferase family protein [Candidatus Binatia bacterium]
MPIDVLMPKLSDTMEEGKIIKWFKQAGEGVAIGDILAEVETDKANMELEAYDEGVLSEVRTAEGESAPVGAVIATLSEKGEAAAPAKSAAPAKPAAKAPVTPAAKVVEETAAEAPGDDAPAAVEPAPEAAKPAAPKPKPTPERPRIAAVKASRPAPSADDEERVRVSPLARRIAEERGIDLRGVTGTGPGGRIVEHDLPDAAAPAPSRPVAPAAPQPRAGGTRRVELSKIRRTTAKRMAQAKQEVPHFYASADIAMDEAVRVKDGLTALGGDHEGLTFTHLVVKAVGMALTRVPELNAAYDDGAMILNDAVNVGVATSVDDGLVVPVLRNCDREPLSALVKQARALVERARAGKFAGDDLSGGTFTVSNLGMLPVSHFAAVVNPPQAAILAVGATRAVPVVRDGQVVPGQVMTVTLSCDHRVVDGVLAGRFLRELKALLENPIALVA